jgi:ATP-dependent exoDNAse (exonuclease V) alpha subunit
MPNDRRSYSQAEQLALTTQVGGECPLCGCALFYTKNSRSYKGYELAHIYPLNPTAEELRELDGVMTLSADVNHPDNLIPLCVGCHPRFDKPRTRAEYEELVKVKKALIARAFNRALFGSYPIEEDLRKIISRLHQIHLADDEISDLQLKAKKADDKFDPSLPNLTRRKIKQSIADYYQHIQKEFKELELTTPNASEVIYSQVKTFYKKQKSLQLPQSVQFENVVEWFVAATKPETKEAAEIMAAFFVQNCEVFE